MCPGNKWQQCGFLLMATECWPLKEQRKHLEVLLISLQSVHFYTVCGPPANETDLCQCDLSLNHRTCAFNRKKMQLVLDTLKYWINSTSVKAIDVLVTALLALTLRQVSFRTEVATAAASHLLKSLPCQPLLASFSVNVNVQMTACSGVSQSWLIFMPLHMHKPLQCLCAFSMWVLRIWKLMWLFQRNMQNTMWSS